MHAVHLRRTVSVETTLLYLTLASSTFALFALFARAISRVMKRHFHRSLLSLSIFFLPSSFFFPLPFRSTSSSYCFVAPLNCILFDEAFFELARRLRTEQKRSQLFFSSRDSEKLFVAGLNCSKRSKGNYRENGFPPIAPFLAFCQLLFTCPFYLLLHCICRRAHAECNKPSSLKLSQKYWFTSLSLSNSLHSAEFLWLAYRSLCKFIFFAIWLKKHRLGRKLFYLPSITIPLYFGYFIRSSNINEQVVETDGIDEISLDTAYLRKNVIITFNYLLNNQRAIRTYNKWNLRVWH